MSDGAPGPDPANRDTAAPRATLRLMFTTDLHAHLRDVDYQTATDGHGRGLTRVATLIRRARTEAADSLLFDAGDLIQGTPLGDWAATRIAPGWLHPMIGALNRLGVHAATPGNHDFNYGLQALLDCHAEARFPVVCANVFTPSGRTLFPPWIILDRRLTDSEGRRRRLRVGVTGVLPPQILNWDGHHLSGQVTVRGVAEAGAVAVAAMRAAGADVTVMLCHSGIGADSDDPGQEHAAMALARLARPDAILAGHAHRRLPGPDFDGLPGCNATAGTLRGVPATMAGAFGSDLGVIDLHLARDAKGWHVTGHRAELRPVWPVDSPAPVPEDRALTRWSAPAHRATLAHAARPVGEVSHRLHTYFAALEPGPALAFIAAAQAAAARDAVAGTDLEGLPLLSAVSPFKCGGRGGWDFYTDVAPGPISLRHVADLYTYPNALQLVHLDGDGLRLWLERAAALYLTMEPGKRRQTLLNGAMPGYESDTVFGARYSIDLSRPSRFDPASGADLGGEGRIRDLTVDSRPVASTDRMLIATNNYRAGGGGAYPGTGPEAMLLENSETLRAAIIRHLGTADRAAAAPARPWRFIPVDGASATFRTSPSARALPEEIARLRLRDQGDTSDGAAAFEVKLS